MPKDPPHIDDLFAAALAEPAASRASFLDQLCGENSEVRDRLSELLAAHDAAGGFLELTAEEPPAPHVTLSERPGSTIGRYKLLEQIGEGGFGVVFMAEQEQPVRRRVALKVIKLGMDTKQVVARFEAERQALAMMDHPNIAKVFDAGSTDTGRPYFVMELVRGVTITAYCDDARLTTNERLVLFQAVCSALQHAHQKGIIHRDLKPSNVLVTLHDDKAVPKVIDFGVAKATQARLTERTLFTEFRQMIGTPSYMSPEQAHMSGLDVDTRSDVYSLGVLLYELLTGSTPIDAAQLTSVSYDDLRRLICEVDPPSPSARLSTLTEEALTTLAKRRRSDPGQLTLHLRSDLDWIVMKCLEKDRARRYESASSLSLDLQRYLDGQPVEARPPTKVYRIAKFIKRNKVGVLAGAAIATALIVGVFLSSIGFFQARRQAEIARTQAARSEQVAQFLQDMLAAAGPSVARGRDATILREILEKTSDRIEKDLADQPEVQGDLWWAIGRTYHDIGDYQRSIPARQRAADCYRAAMGNYSNKVALVLAYLGSSESFVGNVAKGRTDADQGLSIARKIGDPATIATCLECMGGSLHSSGSRLPDSVPFYREALAIRRQLSDPARLAPCLRSLADCLDCTDEAESMARESLELYRQKLGTDNVSCAQTQFVLGQILIRREKFNEAEPVLRGAFDIFRRMHSPNEPFQQFVRECYAYTLARLGKSKECAALLNIDPSDVASWRAFGVVFAFDGQWQLAAEHFEKACKLNPDSQKVLFPFAAVLLQVGREDEYRKVCQNLLDQALKLKNQHYMDMAAKTALMLPVGGQDFDRACRLADQLVDAKAEDWFLSWTYLGKSLAEFRRGRYESAIEWGSRPNSDSLAFPACKATARFVCAAAHAKLHQLDFAKADIAAGDRIAGENVKRGSRYAADWLDWLIADILRREAAQLIGEPPSTSTPQH